MDKSVSIHVNAKLCGIVLIFGVIDRMCINACVGLKLFCSKISHVIVMLMHGLCGLISNKLSLSLSRLYCGDMN